MNAQQKNTLLDTILDGFRGAKFCIQHNLVAQAQTLLREAVLSYIIVTQNEDEFDANVRQIAATCLQTYNVHKRYDKNTKNDTPEEQLIHKFNSNANMGSFSDIYNDLSELDIITYDNKQATFILKGFYNSIADKINQHEKNQMLDELIHSNEEYTFYARYRCDKYMARLSKMQENHHGWSYDQYANWVYDKPSHDWYEELELQRWDTIISHLHSFEEKISR